MQRFREGFSAIPPMRTLGRASGTATVAALPARPRASAAPSPVSPGAHGVTSALRRSSIVDHGASAVIGDRAFHRIQRDAISPRRLRRACARRHGRRRQAFSGALATSLRDSHTELPVDDRPSRGHRRRRSGAPSGLPSLSGLERDRCRAQAASSIPAAGQGSRRAFAEMAARDPARAARLRRPHLFRRSAAWRARRASAISLPGAGRVGCGGVRDGARLQRFRGRGSSLLETWRPVPGLQGPRARCAAKMELRPRGRRGSVRRHCGPRRKVRLHRANFARYMASETLVRKGTRFLAIKLVATGDGHLPCAGASLAEQTLKSISHTRQSRHAHRSAFFKDGAPSKATLRRSTTTSTSRTPSRRS